MIPTRSFLSTILVAASSLMLFSSCASYYHMAVQQDISSPRNPGDIIAANPDRYLVLRQQNRFYGMSDVKLDTAAHTLNTTITTLTPGHQIYVIAQDNTDAKEDSLVENELHVYTSDTTLYTYGQTVQIPYNRIEKIELIQNDAAREKKSRNVGVIVGVAAVAVVAVVIVGALSLAQFSPF